MSAILLKILLSACLGGIIGAEREMAHKEAGLRTNILIALGSTLITILSFEFAVISKTGDPARLAAQIISGIGFLGAGAIMQARFAVHGLTTAATIWVVAGIGIAVGCGFYLISLAITIFVLLVLSVFRYFAAIIERHHHLYVYIITTETRAAVLFDIRKILTELNIHYQSAKLSKGTETYEIELVVDSSDNKNRQFLEKLIQLKGINEVLSENL
jgi:putative Mg2+ transporter-C (MgtC) family protein